MIAISMISIAVMMKANNFLKLVFLRLENARKVYEERLDNLSAINVALSVLRWEYQDISFQPINGELKELLDWWISSRNFLPSEKEMWQDIYNTIVSEGKGFNLKNSAAFTDLMNSLVANGVLSEEVLNKIDAAVYIFSKPPIYLTITRVGDVARWALATQKFLTQYMVVTNRETADDGSPIYYITGDVIDGPYYTTDTLNIYGDPIFKGEVVAGGLNIVEGSSPTFENGYSIITGEPEFTLDEGFASEVFSKYEGEVKDIRSVVENEQTGLLLTEEEFPNDVRIDGVYVSGDTIKLVIYSWERGGRRGKGKGEMKGKGGKRGRWQWVPIYEVIYEVSESISLYDATVTDLETGVSTPIKFNGIVLAQTDLYLSSPSEPSFFGGMITLASEVNVYIRGNIVYSHLRTGPDTFENDTTKYNSISEEYPTNRLNIVAYDSVRIRYYVPDNLYITASIFALTGKFEIDTSEFPSPLWYPLKDYLHVFGMIAQNSRGIMGYFIPDWGPISGFKKDYVYDRRLYSPPYPLATPNMGGSLSVIDLR